MKSHALTGLMMGLCVWVATRDAPAQEPQAARILSLDEALRLALDRSPDVAEAESRLAEAEARLQAARAGGQPTLRARGSYDYWTEDQRLYPATRNGEAGSFGPQIVGAELVASLPIYTGGRLTAEKEFSEWNRQGTSYRLTRVRETLAYQVTAVFYGLLVQDELLRSLDAAVRAMDEQQRTIQALVDAGKAARVDLLRANVRRAELYERQVRERNIRTVQQRAWAALLGLDDSTLPEAQGTLPTVQPTLCPDATNCMRQALARRADYRALQATRSAADAAIRAARAGYRPTLSAQAAYSARWMPDPADTAATANKLKNVGRIGLVVELPLFDGRLTDARVAEQQARLRGIHAQLRKLELQIRFEVEAALAEIAAAKERVQTAQQAVGQAEESFRIVKEKYDLGKGTMTDVLDAQAALVTAQTSYARALADLAVADARRKLAVGEILP